MTTMFLTSTSKIRAALNTPIVADSPDDAQAPNTSLLQDPIDQIDLSGDVGAEVAALVMKSTRAQKKCDREAEEAAFDAQDAAEQRQVDEMHAKADHGWRTAVWSGLGSMASGLAGAAGSAMEPKMPSLGKGLQQGSKAFEGSGKIASGYFDSERAIDDEHVAEAEHAGSHAKRAYDEAHDRVKDDEKLIQSALDFYREFVTAQNQAKKAAIHGA